MHVLYLLSCLRGGEGGSGVAMIPAICEVALHSTLLSTHAPAYVTYCPTATSGAVHTSLYAFLIFYVGIFFLEGLQHTNTKIQTVWPYSGAEV